MCKQDCLEPCSALKSLNGIVSALRLEIPFVLSKCELPPLFYDSRPMSSIQYLRHIKAKIDAVESPVARKLQKLFRNASCVRGYSHQRLPNLHQVLPKCLQLGFSCLDAYNHIEAAGARLERGWVLFLLTRIKFPWARRIASFHQGCTLNWARRQGALRVQTRTLLIDDI